MILLMSTSDTDLLSARASGADYRPGQRPAGGGARCSTTGATTSPATPRSCTPSVMRSRHLAALREALLDAEGDLEDR
jgi:hypothetical protein